jgi:hypothetical protein
VAAVAEIVPKGPRVAAMVQVAPKRLGGSGCRLGGLWAAVDGGEVSHTKESNKKRRSPIQGQVLYIHGVYDQILYRKLYRKTKSNKKRKSLEHAIRTLGDKK